MFTSFDQTNIIWVIRAGKYSDEPNPADEWFKQGKMVSLLFLSLQCRLVYRNTAQHQLRQSIPERQRQKANFSRPELVNENASNNIEVLRNP